MTDGDKTSDGSGRFEGILRVLLNSGYRPPEPRPAFKQDLLARMKVRQAEIVISRRRRQRRRILMFALPAAAAASFMLVTTLVLQNHPQSLPEAAPGVARSSVEETSVELWTGTVAGALEQKGTDGLWRPIRERLTATEPVSLRGLDDHSEVDLVQGIRLFLSKGALVNLNRNGLGLNHGRLRVQVKDGSRTISLALPGHALRLEAGSEVEVAVQDPLHFALGGEPAPDVNVISGRAAVLGRDEYAVPATLLAGRRYQLHPDPSSDGGSMDSTIEPGSGTSRDDVPSQLARFITDEP